MCMPLCLGAAADGQQQAALQVTGLEGTLASSDRKGRLTTAMRLCPVGVHKEAQKGRSGERL